MASGIPKMAQNRTQATRAGGGDGAGISGTGIARPPRGTKVAAGGAGGQAASGSLGLAGLPAWKPRVGVS